MIGLDAGGQKMHDISAFLRQKGFPFAFERAVLCANTWDEEDMAQEHAPKKTFPGENGYSVNAEMCFVCFWSMDDEEYSPLPLSSEEDYILLDSWIKENMPEYSSGDSEVMMLSGTVSENLSRIF